MLANQEISFEIDVVAAVPGTYTGPASCAYPFKRKYNSKIRIRKQKLTASRYLYYTNEYKHWVEGLKVKIIPK